MAKQNITDRFWLEIPPIASATGVDMDKLAGNAIRFFRYAFEKYKDGQAVSKIEFERLGFLPELIPIFAKETEDGIRACGEGKFFSWIAEKSDAGRIGGQASAQRPRDEKGRLLPKQNPSNAQADSKQTQAIQASSSISSSLKKKRKRSELFQPQSSEELWQGMKTEKRESLEALYPDTEFIQREIKKAFAYYHIDKPSDEPRSLAGWSRALSYWLDKAWQDHRRNSRQDRVAASSSPRQGQNQPGRFENLTASLFVAIRKHPPGDEKIAQTIGPDWAWISRSGLVSQIRAMKDDDFARKRVASDLRAAHESFQAKQSATA